VNVPFPHMHLHKMDYIWPNTLGNDYVLLYIRLNLGVQLFHQQAPEIQIVLQHGIGEDRVSSVYLVHVLNMLEGAVATLWTTVLGGQVQDDESLKVRAVPEDVAKTSQPETWHQLRGEKIAGDE